MLDEGLLKRMKLAVLFQPFDGLDVGTIVHGRQCQAGDDAPAVDENRACAASTLIAALLGAGEIQRLAQYVEQRLPCVQFQFLGFAIDDEPD